MPPRKKAAPKKPTVSEQVGYERKIQNLKGEITMLLAKNKELMKTANVQDKILEYAKLSIDVLPRVPVPKRPPVIDAKSVESAVLIGSCWHIGEDINKQEMGGLNEYNFDIFCQRLQFLIERTIQFTTGNMSSHYFEDIHVILTGDMVSGIIHDELEASNQLNIVEQAMLGALVTAQAMLDLARVFPKVIITGVVGNHGRVKHSKYYKHKQTVNWDFVFYNTLAMLLQKQPNIVFNIPMSFWTLVNIQGFEFITMHGDTVKSWGGIPFYGIQREANKFRELLASQGKFFQYWVSSHFHTKGVLQTGTGENILNGSLKGGDEYAAGLGLYSEPAQLLFGVHRKYGKTWELTIKANHMNGLESRYRYDRTKPVADQML